MNRFLKDWGAMVLIFGLLLLSRFFLPLPFATEVLLFAMYTMACNYLLGWVGFISFGQPAYLAVGGYASAIYLFYFGTNPWVAILWGILAGIVVTALVGQFFVRLRSDYFALVNLAFCVIMYYFLESILKDVTQGDNGLFYIHKIGSTPILNLGNPKDLYIAVFGITLLVWIFYRYLDRSFFGACCKATKLNEDKLIFLGYSSFHIRWLSFIIANTTAALAGSLYAVYFGSMSPDFISYHRAADPVVVTILGGVGTLYGPLVGAFAYIGLKDLVSGFFTNWELLIGVILVAIMLRGEKGIYGSLAPWFEKRLFSKFLKANPMIKEGS